MEKMWDQGYHLTIKCGEKFIENDYRRLEGGDPVPNCTPHIDEVERLDNTTSLLHFHVDGDCKDFVRTRTWQFQFIEPTNTILITDVENY